MCVGSMGVGVGGGHMPVATYCSHKAVEKKGSCVINLY